MTRSRGLPGGTIEPEQGKRAKSVSGAISEGQGSLLTPAKRKTKIVGAHRPHIEIMGRGGGVCGEQDQEDHRKRDPRLPGQLEDVFPYRMLEGLLVSAVGCKFTELSDSFDLDPERLRERKRLDGGKQIKLRLFSDERASSGGQHDVTPEPLAALSLLAIAGVTLLGMHLVPGVAKGLMEERMQRQFIERVEPSHRLLDLDGVGGPAHPG